MSDNRDYRDNRDYHLYEIDHDNSWCFDETHFAKHIAKQEGRFACFALFRGQRAVEGTEGRRRDCFAIIAIIANFFVFCEITIIVVIASFFREKRLSSRAIFSRKTKRNDYHYQP